MENKRVNPNPRNQRVRVVHPLGKPLFCTLELALLLVNNLVVAFDASKYRDGYREKLDALIRSKLEAQIPAAAKQRRPAPVVNILDALRRSLEPSRNTPESEESAIPETKKPKRARAKQRSANDIKPEAGMQA